MHVAVFAARRPGFAGHVLPENRAQRHAANQECAHVAMRRANDVVLPQVDAASYRDGFLATTDVHATDDLALAIQFPLDPELQFSRQLHVEEHVEKRFLGWKSDRWYRVPGERVRVRRVHIHWDLQS